MSRVSFVDTTSDIATMLCHPIMQAPPPAAIPYATYYTARRDARADSNAQHRAFDYWQHQHCAQCGQRVVDANEKYDVTHRCPITAIPLHPVVFPVHYHTAGVTVPYMGVYTPSFSGGAVHDTSGISLVMGSDALPFPSPGMNVEHRVWARTWTASELHREAAKEVAAIRARRF
ncbi:MAG TPA: hypothetical protein VJ553_05500 [Candidatus Paceibacterota bacterium]|nr:hypothetical protein [Candidatus Paceibacterota bacterium]